MNIFIFSDKRIVDWKGTKHESSVISTTRQIDAKCKKDARDRLLRNRSGLLGYARFSPYDQRRGLSRRFYWFSF